MLINDYKGRMARVQEKQRTVLRFLRQETWSNVENLGRVMGISSRQGVHRTLVSYESKGWLRRSAFKLDRYTIDLWGITPTGLALSFDEGEEFQEYPNFEPSRISLTGVWHHLDTQQVRLSLEESGASNWMCCDRGEFYRAFKVKHRPDGLVSWKGLRYAIETERTLKTKKRYQQIAAGHLLAIKAGYWDRILYCAPSEALRRAQKRLFESLEYVLIDGSRAPLEAKHRVVFEFVTFDELIC